MDPLTLSFITASTALITAISGPAVSYGVARRPIRAHVISSNREPWVETLRDSIAEYAALALAIAVLEQDAPSDLAAAVLVNDERRNGCSSCEAAFI